MPETLISHLMETEDDELLERKLRFILEMENFMSIRGSSLADKRRRRNAEVLSVGSLEADQIHNMMMEREDEFVTEFRNSGIPEFMLRMEAQDIIMESVYHKLVEEGII